MRYQVIDANGVVINTVVWNVEPPPQIEGLLVIQNDEAGKGWLYSNGTFTPPDPEPG